MAVFPDRIVLKNSTDAQAAIEAAIETGGTDEITQGEIVLGIENTNVKFYTKAGDGSIVSLGGAGVGATTLGELADVDLSTPATDGQVIAYNSTSGNWEPVNQGGGGSSTLAGLTDVTTTDNATTSVYQFGTLPAYTGGRVIINPNASSAYTFAGLSSWDNGNVSIVGGASSAARATISLQSTEEIFFNPDPPAAGADPTDYTLKIEVDGTAGQAAIYRTAPTLGTGTADLVVPTMGQVRSYADSVAGSLDSLSDCSYTSGSLEPTALDQIVFSSADVPGTETWKVFANTTYGAAIGAYDANDDGSYLYVHPTKGVEVRVEETAVVNFTGPRDGGTANTPEIRLNTGSPTSATPTGNYFGLTLPAGYNTDQTYTVPAVDGTSGQVLSTDGAGVLSWVDGGSGGGGGSTGSRLTETQTASSGAATFTGLGHNGTLVKVTSSLDAWIVLYGSAADRTSDAGRSYSTDPAAGSGVLAEFYVTAGSTVLATPGTTYFNNDTSVTEALYAAVRDQAGASVDSEVTIVAYGEQVITTVTGGTFGSG